MRGDVARDHEPSMAALAVMPVLLVQSGRIIAEIDVIDPGLLCGGIEALRPSHGRVTTISEFLERPLTAIRAVDPHRLASVLVGLRAHALLVDHAACRQAIEPVGGRIWMRLVLGYEVREADAGGRRRLEAAIAPAGIEIEPIDRRLVDDG